MSDIAMLISDILTVTMIENDLKCLVYKEKMSKILGNILTNGNICSIILSKHKRKDEKNEKIFSSGISRNNGSYIMSGLCGGRIPNI